MHRIGSVTAIVLVALALLPPLAATASWRSSATVPVGATFTADAVDLVMPGGEHSAAWDLGTVDDIATSTVYGEVTSPLPEVTSTGFRPLTYWVASVTATGIPAQSFQVSARVLGPGATRCEASSFDAGTPVLTQQGVPVVKNAPDVTAPSLTLTRGQRNRICARYDFASADLWGQAVTVTWGFAARNDAGTLVPYSETGIPTPRVRWEQSFEVSVPPPVNVTCTDVPPTLGLAGGSVRISWIWPPPGAGSSESSLSGFEIYLANGSEPVSETVGATDRSWTMSVDIIKSLLGALLGTTLTVVVSAMVNGRESDTSTPQQVSFTVLPLVTARCATPS